MGRLLAIVAATLLAALAVVAAPALSTEEYRPSPVDFWSSDEGVLGNPGPGAGVVSRPIEAPKRFNLVGLSWDVEDGHGDGDGHDGTGHGDAGHGDAAHDHPGHAEGEHDHADEPKLAMRTRLDGGEWSRWTAIAAHPEDGPDPGMAETAAGGMSNPVWAGEADWVQYRSSRPLENVRLHFINTAGTATAADRVQTALRGVASSATLAAAGVLGADAADGQDRQPDMVSRSRWARNDCNPRTAPSFGEVRAAYIHHTVNINTYSRAEAPQVVLGICRYHRNSNGWNDVGYNFLVDRFGTIYEGRAGGIGAAVIGAQAEGFNSQSTGIANVGTFTSVPQSEAAIDAMARLLRWKLPLHGYPTTGSAILRSAGGSTTRYPAGASVRVRRIIGHRDTNATACPGDTLYAQLGDLRARAAGVAPSGTATHLSAELDAPRSAIDFGEDAKVAGTLAARDGTPVAGQAVSVQALIGGRWATSSSPVTGADGSFSAPIKPRLTRQLRVRFAGAGELRASISPTLTLAVRTAVRLRAPSVGAQPAARRAARRATGRRARPAGPSGLARRRAGAATRNRPDRRARAAASPGERIAVRGRVRPRVRRVQQVLRVKRGERFRMAGTRWLRVGSRGFFRGSFVPSSRGVYRVYVVARATAARARGVSEKVDVAVGVRGSARPQRGGAQAR